MATEDGVNIKHSHTPDPGTYHLSRTTPQIHRDTTALNTIS